MDHPLTLLPAGSSVALGLFDGVHVGHMAVIRKAVESAGESLTPCVFTFDPDKTVPESKVRYSELLTPEQKARRMAELGVREILSLPFEEVRDYSGEDFFHKILMEKMHAKVLCCGEDYRFGRGAQCGVEELRRFCQQENITLHALAKVELEGGVVSSTRIREAIRQGQVDLAATLLGERFTLEFEVIHGRRLGRTLGTPTINQRFPESFTIPKFGVYAAIAHVDGKTYPAVTNVGVKPTVGSAEILAETYIVGYSGDLYGKIVPVELVRFQRPEQKFSGIEELMEQIHRDARNAVEIIGALPAKKD